MSNDIQRPIFAAAGHGNQQVGETDSAMETSNEVVLSSLMRRIVTNTGG
jgi:protein subunit release factor A